MKILVIASHNSNLPFTLAQPFVVEQANALLTAGVEIDFFGVTGKGILGYLKARRGLLQKIRTFHPDIIHAHYGLCGLLANLQRKVPVVTTYHGSDINVPSVLRFSKIAMRLSAFNIFVSKRNVELALGVKSHESGGKKNYILLPCGVDIDNFAPRTREEARQALGWGRDEKKVLFAGAFNNVVKNADLAKETIALLDKVALVELKGYSREQIANLFYAADALLMTSHTEGSPQVVKEAMACGCPIVSVDVGDVAERIAGVEKCYIAERTPEDIAAKLRLVLQNEDRTNGRERLMEMGLDNRQVAEKLIEIYKNVSS